MEIKISHGKVYDGPVMGNEKKQEGEVLDSRANGSDSCADSVVMLKDGQVMNDEPRAADTNRFGDGTTTIDAPQKDGWTDPR